MFAGRRVGAATWVVGVALGAATDPKMDGTRVDGGASVRHPADVLFDRSENLEQK